MIYTVDSGYSRTSKGQRTKFKISRVGLIKKLVLKMKTCWKFLKNLFYMLLRNYFTAFGHKR